ncbi:MAG: hypothetical protein IPO07_28150 [Haliscomenobacter sp.]|nr:hypothetical protein [Haliscomenobacter sp.]MBK9492227.1 hypothetical protein [Haliscomenobacter sp.]
MKNTIALISAFLFLNAMLGLSGCKSRIQWEQEQAELLRQTVELEQRHCQIKASVDSLWDVTSAQLARVFPVDFPSIDRDIFIKARNADHIRMFMSFKQLDAAAQSLVNQAGEQDKNLQQKSTTYWQRSRRLNDENSIPATSRAERQA